MKLDVEHLQTLANIAIEAAKEAGALIATYADKDVTVNNKDGGDSYASQVVTAVDLLSQDVVLKHLKPTLEQYDLALLTEEHTDDRSRLDKDYFWCVDPIDGTLPFIEKVHGYSVSIGLVSKSGNPMIGVIFDPMKSVLFHAIEGVGVFRNQQPWSYDPHQNRTVSLTWVMDRSLKKDPYYDRFKDALTCFTQENQIDLKYIQTGGGAMNACWVLENSPACYFKPPKKQDGGGSLWDYSASACIFKQIGGHVSDIFGEPMDLNRADSTFMNHQGILYASDSDLAAKVMQWYQEMSCDSGE